MRGGNIIREGSVEMTNSRYSTNYRIIYDKDNKLTLEEVVQRLNNYEVLMRELTTDGDFSMLIGLMNDNNLTWKSVTNIIKEALP